MLKWPEALNQAFRDAVEKMQFNDDIATELRNHYQNYIENHFPGITKTNGAQPLEGNEASGLQRTGPLYARNARNGAGGIGRRNDYICEWFDQNVIRDELNFPQRPSSLRIWVTQEESVGVHTLLDVIDTAAGATPQVECRGGLV